MAARRWALMLGAFLTWGCSDGRVQTVDRIELSVPAVAPDPATDDDGSLDEGRHLLVWTRRGDAFRTDWLQQQGSYTRVIATRHEPVVAVKDRLWVLAQRCWLGGQTQHDCRELALKGLEQGAGKERWSGAEWHGVRTLGGSELTPVETMRELRVAPTHRAFGRGGERDRVLGLPIDDLIRPYRAAVLASAGPYVFVEHDMAYGALASVDGLLEVYDLSRQEFVPLIAEGAWDTVAPPIEQARWAKAEALDEVTTMGYRLLAEEPLRLQAVLPRYGDDATLGVRLRYAVSLCCRRSCSIGPLEAFAAPIEFDGPQHIPRLAAHRKVPAPVQAHWRDRDASERGGWSEVTLTRDALRRALQTFADRE